MPAVLLYQRTRSSVPGRRFRSFGLREFVCWLSQLGVPDSHKETAEFFCPIHLLRRPLIQKIRSTIFCACGPHIIAMLLRYSRLEITSFPTPSDVPTKYLSSNKLVYRKQIIVRSQELIDLIFLSIELAANVWMSSNKLVDISANPSMSWVLCWK